VSLRSLLSLRSFIGVVIVVNHPVIREGRPKKKGKILTKSIRLSEPLAGLAKWLRKHPEAIPEVQKLMTKYA
jgi:hypothetical protein